jgi:hypothetical protein
MSKIEAKISREKLRQQGPMPVLKGRYKVKFQAYCPDCAIRVNASTMLTGNELQLALNSDEEIAVIHTINVDHQWKLINREKRTLLDRIASGSLSAQCI